MKTLFEHLNESMLCETNSQPNDKTKLIEDFCKQCGIKKYTINNDLTIDCYSPVVLSNYSKERLPNYIKFKSVMGGFYIDGCPQLKSLKGCPKEVTGVFDCSGCRKIISLEGAPSIVDGDFYCNDCPKLESLKGVPKGVGGNFYCDNCGEQFTEDDVKKYCKVKGRISV